MDTKTVFRATAAILVVAVFAWVGDTLRWAWDLRVLKTELKRGTDGKPESLAPIGTYLSAPLERKDFASFEKRVGAVETVLEDEDIDDVPESAFWLLDPEDLDRACATSEMRSGSGTVSEWCERRDFEKTPEGIRNCGEYRFPSVRKSCADANDLQFSTTSLAHCSKSECVVDNAVFRTVSEGGKPCAAAYPPLVSACLSVLESYGTYGKDPTIFFRTDFEDALSGKTADPFLKAAASAVLEYADSPASACARFSGKEDSEKCESLSKSLFSYVQLRALGERLRRIEKAVHSRTSPRPPETSADRK